MVPCKRSKLRGSNALQKTDRKQRMRLPGITGFKLGSGHTAPPKSTLLREEMTMANAVIAGEIETLEDGELYNHKMALLIEFDSPEEIREAIASKKCEFAVFGE